MPNWLEIVLRTLMAVAVLFVLTKLLGKRQISELSLFEYITGISIGNIAGYVSLDVDNLWYLGLVSLIVWVGVAVGIEWWTLKSKKASNWIDGKGRVLIREGQLQKDMMKKERLTMDELMAQLRSKDVYRVADVEFAVMESSGEINVMLKKQYQPLTPDMLGWQMSDEREPQTLIMDGQVLDAALRNSGKDNEWLKGQLKRYKLKPEDVYVAQLEADDSILFHLHDGRILPSENGSKPADRIQSLTRQLESELRRLERFSRNENDRRLYQHAIDTLQSGIAKLNPNSGNK
ncbi:DUF421 domain-containing protein [Paenibacillus sp. J5C_2022]|uniref:DUF421 domain-containing protein n=1 Tax=Paenibacillus sp. J5C2022 TaxID=2977129 RepID=UPI0021CEEC70|nr:DUF421 domain-containing protein [Paenibacillus sp. J5C2022]MCU6712763.1 DUF421 domain-containing protein [Paenibacillus sp. J5C2022]